MMQSDTLQPLWDAIAAQGLSTTDGELRGRVALKFAKAIPEFMGRPETVNEYHPVITLLEVVQQGVTTFTVSPDSPLFASITEHLPDLITLPLHTRIELADLPALDDQAEFLQPLARLAKLDRLETWKIAATAISDKIQ